MRLKRLIEVLGRRLPDNWYFFIFRLLYFAKNSARRGCQTRFGAVEPGLFVAEDPDGRFMYFSVRSRFARYLFPQGLKKIQQDMELKYCVGCCSVAAGDTVLDIGANIGEFAIAIASHAAHVYCIEPDPKVFRALQKNTEALDNVTILQAAVSNETGTIDFYLSTEGADSSIFTPREYTEKIVINALSLDDLIAKYKIVKVTFIKLEAEGWEPEVLLGATSTLKVCNKISVDAGPERGSSSTVEEVSAILISAGFNVQVTNNIVTATRTRGPC